MTEWGQCVTHHHACDCRERQWQRMWKALELIVGKTVHCPHPDCPCDRALQQIREDAKSVLNWRDL